LCRRHESSFVFLQNRRRGKESTEFAARARASIAASESYSYSDSYGATRPFSLKVA